MAPKIQVFITLQYLIKAQAGINARVEDHPILINARDGINAQCNFCWYIIYLLNRIEMEKMDQIGIKRGKIEEENLGEKSKKL